MTATTANPDLSNYYKDAFLSEATYEKNVDIKPLKVGSTIKDGFENEYEVLAISKTESDYQGYAFRDTATGGITIAHRGTEVPKVQDWIADGAIGMNNIPDQVQDAISFNKEVLALLGETSDMSIDPSTINQTGHSLGGGIAKLIAAMNNSSATTFNAPIVSHLIDNLAIAYPDEGFSDVDLETLKDKITEIREMNDFVSIIPPYGDHLGETLITVNVPNSTDEMGNIYSINPLKIILIKKMG